MNDVMPAVAVTNSERIGSLGPSTEERIGRRALEFAGVDKPNLRDLAHAGRRRQVRDGWHSRHDGRNVERVYAYSHNHPNHLRTATEAIGYGNVHR